MQHHQPLAPFHAGWLAGWLAICCAALRHHRLGGVLVESAVAFVASQRVECIGVESYWAAVSTLVWC